MYPGWLMFGGTELVNTQRAATYAQALGVTTLGCTSCPDLSYMLNDPDYTTPAGDAAPWYDAGVPESAQFAGFAGLGVVGISKSTAVRESTELAGEGARLNPPYNGARDIVVTVLAVAASKGALSYGVSWLSAALRGQICTGPCAGDELCFFTACVSCLDNPYCGDRELRTIYDVGRTSGPEVLSRTPLGGGGCGGGGVVAQIEFTLLAGRPHIYLPPVTVVGANELTTHYTGLTVAGPTSTPACVEATDCLQDPLCPAPPSPPSVPVPVDPCFPTDPYTAERFVVTVPPNLLAEWWEKVPVVSVYSGSSAMRRLAIRMYANNLGGNCADYIDPCASCAEVNLAYLPPGATFSLDGRIETAWVDCAGGPGQATAEPTVYGSDGQLFSWPVFDCSTALCIEVLVQQGFRAADSRISVAMVARTDLA